MNNTIYGKDGVASAYSELGTQEPNDLPSNAVDTRQGSDHGPLYQTFGQIGDGDGTKDVDFYEVELGLGDRLTIDVDTLVGGPDTHLRLFDSNGVEVASNVLGTAPAYLNGILTNPLDPTVPFPDPDDPTTLSDTDPYIDFTATAPGTYYVAVSSQGNESYDPLTLSGRVQGNGGTGLYGISVNVFAPRTFTLNFDAGGQTTDFTPLLGTTITVTHTGDVNVDRNTTVFEFVNAGTPPTGAGNVPIPLQNTANSRVPDVLRSIQAAIAGVGIRAAALGGVQGNGPGLITFDYDNRDLNGWGHDRNADVDFDQPGTTESFVWVLGIADLFIDDAATAAGLRLGPRAGSNAQSGIPEAGLVTTLGSSATVMNNLFANLDTSRVDDARAS